MHTPGATGHSTPDETSADPGRADPLEQQLHPHGFTNVTVISDKMETHGRAVYKADSRTGEKVAIRAYKRSEKGGTLADAGAEVIRLSALHHPHILQPQSFVRTPDALFIVTEYANGGDLFHMVRRDGGHGLPGPRARFLFQQLVLALEFCHEVNIYIRNINPSNLLIFWSDKGKPILKISDFRVSKRSRLQRPSQSTVVATMYSSPHMVRQAGEDRKVLEDLAPVCDVWAAVVTLYFLLTGRWPFTKKQIIAWASTEEEEWNDDTEAMAVVDGAGLPAEVVQLFRDVFAGGRLSAKAFHVACRSIQSIIDMTWFQEDLPPEAQYITKIYLEKTAERQTSAALQRLRNLVRKTCIARGRAAPASAGGPRDGGEPAATIGADWHAPTEAGDPWVSLAVAFRRFAQASQADTADAASPFDRATVTIPASLRVDPTDDPTEDPTEDLGLDPWEV